MPQPVTGFHVASAAVRSTPFKFRYTTTVASAISTAPRDFVEGVGQGDTLQPGYPRALAAMASVTADVFGEVVARCPRLKAWGWPLAAR